MSQSCCLHLQVITVVNAATLAPCLLTSLEGVFKVFNAPDLDHLSLFIICGHFSQRETSLASSLVSGMRDHLLPKEFLEVPLSSTKNSVVQNI